MHPLEIIRRARERRSASEVTNILQRAVPPPVSGADALARLRAVNEAQPESEKVISEAQRILALPTWDRENFKIDMTAEFKLPNGTMKLNPVQSLALYFARQTGGLVAPLAVGSGKTLLTMLLPVAMGARRPLLLLPSDMQIPFRRELEKMKPHWRLPITVENGCEPLKVMAYSQLSTAKFTDVLSKINPDLIIADEAHNLRYPSAARTKRLLRFFQSYPNTRFVGMSGTFTSKGLRDFAHLSELALRDGTPLPLNEADLIAWANVIDADAVVRTQDLRTFSQFCSNLDQLTEEEIERAWREIRANTEEGQRLFRDNGTNPARAQKRAAREAFRARFNSTPGVVATKEGSVSCSLVLRQRPLIAPSVIQAALQALSRTWCRPDGEELVTGLDYWRCCGQLAQGFYYRWVWPDGIVDTEWLVARASWHREVRGILQKSLVGLDSPLLVTRAVMDGRLDQFPQVTSTEARVLIWAWNQWSTVKHRPKPPTETVWLDDFLIQDALAWRKENPLGLIWIDDRAVENELRRLGELVYGAGTDPPESGNVGYSLSIASFGTGRNLQKHSTCLYLSFPPSGKQAEQSLGRLHRQGQEADQVTVDFYSHTEGAAESIRKACRDAAYISESQGVSQKLLFCSWI